MTVTIARDHATAQEQRQRPHSYTNAGTLRCQLQDTSWGTSELGQEVGVSQGDSRRFHYVSRDGVTREGASIGRPSNLGVEDRL